MNIQNNNCIFRTLVPFSFASSHIARVVTVVTRAVTTLLQSSFQVQIRESCSVILLFKDVCSIHNVVTWRKTCRDLLLTLCFWPNHRHFVLVLMKEFSLYTRRTYILLIFNNSFHHICLELSRLVELFATLKSEIAVLPFTLTYIVVLVCHPLT